jgi:hypothetical protein
MCGLDPRGSGQKSAAGYCEHGKEVSGSIKSGDSWTR